MPSPVSGVSKIPPLRWNQAAFIHPEALTVAGLLSFAALILIPLAHWFQSRWLGILVIILIGTAAVSLVMYGVLSRRLRSRKRPLKPPVGKER